MLAWGHFKTADLIFISTPSCLSQRPRSNIPPFLAKIQTFTLSLKTHVHGDTTGYEVPSWPTVSTGALAPHHLPAGPPPCVPSDLPTAGPPSGSRRMLLSRGGKKRQAMRECTRPLNRIKLRRFLIDNIWKFSWEEGTQEGELSSCHPTKCLG